jgi:hypothetical protein
MLRRLTLAAALTLGAFAFAGLPAMAQESAPSVSHPAHPQHNRHAGSRFAHHHRGPAHAFGKQTEKPKTNRRRVWARFKKPALAPAYAHDARQPRTPDRARLRV